MLTSKLIECFNDTLVRSQSGMLQSKTDRAIHSSRIYFEGYVSAHRAETGKADITVESTTTFAAAAQYRHTGKVAVLNFANPENPGGGVKHGAMAQEECLCRCSNLYPCLVSPRVYRDYYDYHRKMNDPFYSDRIIYPKDGTIFKDEDLNLLPQELCFDVDVITCAAAYLGNAAYVDRTVLFEMFESRAKNIFETAAENGAEILILGAFGCGAFMNPPEIVAEAFRRVIEEQQYDRSFKKIVFAIKAIGLSGRRNLLCFQKEFARLGEDI